MRPAEFHRLQGHVAALETVCILMINVFAKKASLRASFVSTLRSAIDELPVRTDPVLIERQKGIVEATSKITDHIIRDEIE